MSLLETHALQSGYGRIPVLHGIDMEVGEGEIVGVIGANGAGKSTLMKTLARILWVIAGEIVFAGRPAVGLQPFEMTELGLGYVPQERNVFPDLTVEENLRMGGYLGKDPARAMRSAFERFPILEERRGQRAGTLSGGERQMLAVACALMLEPKLLILDEPTSGLAPQVTAAMIESVVQINQEGTSVIWVVEENPRDVIRHCDRVYFLESGSVIRTDTGQGFLEDENFEALFLGRRELC
ncbi:MAG: ABC transporter ATP-binding protein [Actinobacteria bacterium]|nr:ABC transporter ATP-binding protein [Actinomycetota bacterium]